MPNLPLCDWSSQLFDLRAPSSTDVPVLLQPSIVGSGGRREGKRKRAGEHVLLFLLGYPAGAAAEERIAQPLHRAAAALVARPMVRERLACSRLRDGGGKSLNNKKCEKHAGAGERQVVRVLFSLCSF